MEGAPSGAASDSVGTPARRTKLPLLAERVFTAGLPTSRRSSALLGGR